MTPYNFKLNTNLIYPAICNMIISMTVGSDNIAGTFSELCDSMTVDGTLYGDTKLYYSTDVLESHAWLNDAEAANLLSLDRPDAPEVQAITIDNYRQIRVTLDNLLTKQAFMNDGAFSTFTNTMLAWLNDTQRVYKSTLFNTYIGTTASTIGNQSITIEPVADVSEAQVVAQKLADILIDLKDVSRNYNDYEYLRSYNEDSLIVVWNSAVYNKLTYLDLPTIFHKEGLLNSFKKYVLPARYFGTVSSATTVPSDGVYRSLIETTIDNVHYFPGDQIPAGKTVATNTTYKEDPTIAFKIMHKGSVPFMSGFNLNTQFFNPRSHTSNYYLTFGYNTLQYLYNYPFITAKISST